MSWFSAIAPFRLDLSAGFPDVPPLYEEQMGAVLNVALREGVSVHYAPTLSRPAGLVRRIVRSLEEFYSLDGWGVDIERSTFPTGAGLGTSGALSSALALCVSSRAKIALPSDEVARLAIWAERMAGNYCGCQDQFASCQGGVGLVRCWGGDVGRERLDIDLSGISDRLLVVHPGGERVSGAMVHDVVESVLRSPGSLRLLSQVSELAIETTSRVLRADFESLAVCVRESARILMELDSRIVQPEMATLLVRCGVVAGKPCGAGGPGAAWVVVVDPERRTQVRDSLRQHGVRCLAPSLSGWGAQIVPRRASV